MNTDHSVKSVTDSTVDPDSTVPLSKPKPAWSWAYGRRDGGLHLGCSELEESRLVQVNCGMRQARAAWMVGAALSVANAVRQGVT